MRNWQDHYRIWKIWSTDMNNLNNIEIFKNNISTFKETSKDKNDGNILFMTESLTKVVDFDGVKNEYIKDMKLADVPCSNDALYLGDGEKLTFVEFKNGKMSKQKVFDVYYKIYDSLLILNDIISHNISYCREHLNFILVYNGEKNQEEKEMALQENQESPSKITIGKYFNEKKAKKKFIRFGLEKFEKIYFNEVFTYNEAEFEEKFLKNNT